MDVALSYDEVVGLDRPDWLARDETTTEAVMVDILKNELAGEHIDVVVLLQATSPLREPEDTDKAIEVFLRGGFDSLFSVSKMSDAGIWDSKMNSITYDYKNRKRRQDKPTYYIENGSIYIFKPEILVEHNNRLGGKMGMYEMDYWKSFQIDEPEDIEICEYFMNSKILNG
jgi:N-acylneuraminate cytidylyltransferase